MFKKLKELTHFDELTNFDALTAFANNSEPKDVVVSMLDAMNKEYGLDVKLHLSDHDNLACYMDTKSMQWANGAPFYFGNNALEKVGEYGYVCISKNVMSREVLAHEFGHAYNYHKRNIKGYSIGRFMGRKYQGVLASTKMATGVYALTSILRGSPLLGFTMNAAAEIPTVADEYFATHFAKQELKARGIEYKGTLDIAFKTYLRQAAIKTLGGDVILSYLKLNFALKKH